MTHKQLNTVKSRYQNAQKLLQGFLTKKVASNTTLYPTWIEDTDLFWYVRDLRQGKEFRLVDAQSSDSKSAFDHQLLAEALAYASAENVSANNLPFSTIDIDLKERLIIFSAFNKRWQFDQNKGTCQEIPMPLSEEVVISPNGKSLIFCKDHNLWLRDLTSGIEKALTTDGQSDYSYAEPSTAWGFKHTNHLQVAWSPNNKRIFVVQRDTRKVKTLPTVHHVPMDGSIRPQVTFSKIAYPGDEHVETLRLLIIDIATGKMQPADYGQIPVTRNNLCFFSSNLGWWNKNSQIAYFVDVDRYYKYVRLIELDTNTGRTKILFEEISDTQINLMNNGDMHPSYVPLPETNELLWYSERTGWAHLYLYDLSDGRLKNIVTKGDWLVRDVVSVNVERREAFIQTGCRTSGRNPYYRDLLRVNIDTGQLFTVISSNHDYFCSAFTDMQGYVFSGVDHKKIEKRGISPTGNYAVVTRSRVDTLPESFIVDYHGNQLMTLEVAEIQELPDNWQPPEPVQVLAADGKTEIYGVVYRPSDFSPNKSYPIVNEILNTPDFPWSAIGAFDNSYFEGQSFFTAAAAIAELGFIVVQIDGRGGAYRDKAFKDTGYGNLHLPTMQADQVAAIQQLAERYSYMDLNRVGIYESVGGPGVLHGMLDYPDFYKVGVTHFPHDTRLMASTMWGDMFEGEVGSVGAFPEDKVGALKGKLLLTNGMLDVCTPPAGVFRVVEALQKENKDFEMILLPNLGHGFSNYLTRRVWDFLIRNLMEEEPPKEFYLTAMVG